MSLTSWYLHKADQCARMARDAFDPCRRSNLETESRLWFQIAARIEIEEAREAERPARLTSVQSSTSGCDPPAFTKE